MKMKKEFYTEFLNRVKCEIDEFENIPIWMYTCGKLDTIRTIMIRDEELSDDDYKEVSDLYIEVADLRWRRFDIVLDLEEAEVRKESVTS